MLVIEAERAGNELNEIWSRLGVAYAGFGHSLGGWVISFRGGSEYILRFCKIREKKMEICLYLCEKLSPEY